MLRSVPVLRALAGSALRRAGSALCDQEPELPEKRRGAALPPSVFRYALNAKGKEILLDKVIDARREEYQKKYKAGYAIKQSIKLVDWLEADKVMDVVPDKGRMDAGPSLGQCPKFLTLIFPLIR
ncbi:hypothetical protein NDU88_006721 [Pleurodeles waltl]|uniref:Uncharacterized protein n=1 Tax=Pleurodeles waltl TaxID=8319 RepID=A0AAV7QM06_PLEWA|nr:hypothetical protein NDU88_006721 [Pleurodeles waltl]